MRQPRRGQGYTGVGSTALARALAGSIDCQFVRVQCNSDLLAGRCRRHQCLRPARAAIRVPVGLWSMCAVRSLSFPAAPEAVTACRGAHLMSATISAKACTAVRHHPAGDRAYRSVCARRTRPRRRPARADRERKPRLRRLRYPCSPAWARSDCGCCASHSCSLGATPCLRAARRCETRSGCRRWLAGRRRGSGRPARGWRASRCSAWGRGSRGRARRARRRWGR